MSFLQFDSVGGASGDMILGALIDLGADPDTLRQALSSLGVGPFDLEVRRHESHGLHGTQVTVRIGEHAAHKGSAPHSHHPERGLEEIKALIEDAALPGPVKETSRRVFTRLAEAEARVHGTTPDRIHFHEVGAVDSILDIVGACLALHGLGVDGVAVGPLPLGSGTLTCAHGVYPVPAPATVELLKGFPVVQTGEPHELVTPTGAALLAEWRTYDAAPPGSRIARAGYGFGHRRLNKRPNVLRATLLEEPEAEPATEHCLILECNVDDSTPELLGNLAERLLQAGALDVFTTPVQMKKQRPGVLVTVLCAAGQRERMLELLFTESTTFGVREREATRTVLARRREDVETPYGTVVVKVGSWKGRDITFAPEMDDCIRRAREHDVPARTVYESAVRARRPGSG